MISDNRASPKNAQGGGVYGATLTNCLVVGNLSGPGGGGGWCGGAAASELVNCTVFDNRGETYGGVEMSSTVKNCIVWSNTVPSGAVKDIRNSTVFYTCASDGLTHGAAGNITNNPVFRDPALCDFRLTPASPCLNTGGNLYAPTNASPVDLAGAPRVLEGVVDMGAYEFLRPPPQATLILMR